MPVSDDWSIQRNTCKHIHKQRVKWSSDQWTSQKLHKNQHSWLSSAVMSVNRGENSWREEKNNLLKKTVRSSLSGSQMPLRHPLLRNSTVDVTESTLTTSASNRVINASSSSNYTLGAGGSSSAVAAGGGGRVGGGRHHVAASGGGGVSSSAIKLIPNKLPQQHSLPQSIFRRQHAIDLYNNSSVHNSPLGRSSIPQATPTIILSPNNSVDSAPSIPDKTKQRLKQEQWGTSSRQGSSLNSSLHSNGDIRSCKNRSRKSSLKSLFDIKESARKRFSVIPQVSLTCFLFVAFVFSFLLFAIQATNLLIQVCTHLTQGIRSMDVWMRLTSWINSINWLNWFNWLSFTWTFRVTHMLSVYIFLLRRLFVLLATIGEWIEYTDLQLDHQWRRHYCTVES